MSIHRTRKQKEMPHYGFLVSWQPPEARVKRELKKAEVYEPIKPKEPKRANSMAQGALGRNVKRDIVRSIITISLILILELVVYLAWIKFNLS